MSLHPTLCTINKYINKLIGYWLKAYGIHLIFT